MMAFTDCNRARMERSIYTSSRGGNVDIRAIDPEGNKQRQITSAPAIYQGFSSNPKWITDPVFILKPNRGAQHLAREC